MSGNGGAGRPKIARVALCAISRRLEMQVRGKTDPAVVHRYELAMRSGAPFPPLGVAIWAGLSSSMMGFTERRLWLA